MTRKPSGLVAAIKRDRVPAPPPEPQAEPARPDSRKGKKTIAFWADTAAARQLRRLAADEDSTVQDLMLEALDDLFRKRGLPRIAQEERA
ncbi:MAG: hypothetical protein JOY71_19325 [Acetobacteraceae bacterium]|nr:hypothetical protein [Acetobacteraceae bacterium]MBV8524246.1 hypothetical protein [Acetobacteraceae bacterium]MBV8591169.1 hypothetical protein [Acetobacteraceae bacterium]